MHKTEDKIYIWWVVIICKAKFLLGPEKQSSRIAQGNGFALHLDGVVEA
jgi:hypothetical protein